MATVYGRNYVVGNAGKFYSLSGVPLDYVKSIGIKYTYMVMLPHMEVNQTSCEKNAKEIEIFVDKVAQAVATL